MEAASASTDPITTDRPTPPAPKTATLIPGRTLALFSTAPTPVVTPQPIRAETSKGRSGMRTQLKAGTTECVAHVEIAAR